MGYGWVAGMSRGPIQMIQMMLRKKCVGESKVDCSREILLDRRKHIDRNT